VAELAKIDKLTQLAAKKRKENKDIYRKWRASTGSQRKETDISMKCQKEWKLLMNDE
jgi:hypothetical protein